MNATGRARDLVNGYQVSQALHVAAELGLSDHLAAGPHTVAELAEITRTDPSALGRLLRALAEVEVYARDGDTYALTELGAELRSGERLHGWARHIGRAYYWSAWAALEHSVRTGENGFESVHGESVWAYRAQHPADGATFNAAMTGLSASAAPALLEAYDLAGVTSLVDVGGGRGALLAAVLTAYDDMRGVLFDLPHVVADPLPELASGPLAARCEIVGGDAFVAVPARIDVYVMRSVIHDWEDPQATAILRVCRESAGPVSRLLLVERVLDEGDPATRRTAAFSDLNMLVAPGGRERTREEFAALLSSADFEVTRVVPTRAGQFVLEARPV